MSSKLTQGPSQAPIERGFTLVELMIALVVSTILIYFLFSVQTRMTRAFRSQSTIADVTQTLRATRTHLQRELQMAGYGLPGGRIGVSTAVAGTSVTPTNWPALQVLNNVNEGTDQFRVIYGDVDTDGNRYRIWWMNAGQRRVSFDDPLTAVVENHPFQRDELVIIRSRTSACLVEITRRRAADNDIVFAPSSIYNETGNPHCTDVAAELGAGEFVEVLRAVVREYRINTTLVPGQGILQMMEGGEVTGRAGATWTDLGFGFTNLQLAYRYLTDLPDPAVDIMTWRSSASLADPWQNRESTDVGYGYPVAASLAIEVKSPFGSRGAPSMGTPAFGLAGNDINEVGDWGAPCPANPTYDPCGIDLANLPDASRPARYRGENIYRFSVTKVDLRNIGLPKI